MPFSANHFYKAFLQSEFLNSFKHFIVVNKFIKQFLQTDYYIDESNIKLFHPFFKETSQLLKDTTKNKSGVLNVGFIGTANWQKGFDLLSTLIAMIKYNYNINNFHFTWVGFVEENQKAQILFELTQIDCTEVITFTGKLLNPELVYQQFDVMCSLSKEDSFPLSCLEAANFGKPIICFEKSGGMASFVINNVSGFIIPYLDINTLCKKLFFLQANLMERIQMGIEASESAKAFEINKQAPLLLQYINTLF
jgi:glycosyltransferase involved in cell wall biosynthesis